MVFAYPKANTDETKESFGFQTWQTTLLGCVSGVIEILTSKLPSPVS
jgi:hypothetical protein